MENTKKTEDLSDMNSHLTKTDKSICCPKAVLSKIEESEERCPLVADNAHSESIHLISEGMAHDLNYLIPSIMSNLSLAKVFLGYKEDEKTLERLSMTERYCEKIKDLSAQIQVFSKSRSCPAKVTTLSRLIKKTAAYTLRSSNTALSFDLPEDLWPVKINEEQLIRVFEFLIGKSSDSLDDGGKMRISGENLFSSEKENRLSQRKKHVAFEIRHESPGIAPDQLPEAPKISRRNQLQSKVGPGLGYALCNIVIKEHSGYIIVNAKPGFGMIAKIFLPANHFGNSESDELCFSQGKILISTIDEDFRNAAGTVLYYLGYEPVFVKDIAESIETLKESKTRESAFNAVILDTDGKLDKGLLDFVPDVIKAAPGIDLFAVSSHEAVTDAETEYRRLGFRNAMKKPLSMTEIRNKLISKV